MSRYSSSGSYGHTIRKLRTNEYEIAWTVDFYYKGVRQRFPRRFRRDTNVWGAKRFAKKWGLKCEQISL